MENNNIETAGEKRTDVSVPVCVFCKKALSDNMSDSVFCPMCGEGYHRQCWRQTGERCMLCTDLNLSGKTMSAEISDSPPPDLKNAADKLNDSIQQLKKSLIQLDKEHGDHSLKIMSDDSDISESLGDDEDFNLVRIRRHILDQIRNDFTPEQLKRVPYLYFLVNYKDSLFLNSIYDLSPEKIFVFTGCFNPARLILFHRISSSGVKISFNISAVLFTPFYQFYLRMRFAGVLFTSAVYCATLPFWITVIIDRFGNFSRESTPSLFNFIDSTTEYMVPAYAAVVLFAGLFTDFIYLKFISNKVHSCWMEVMTAKSTEFFSALRNSDESDFSGEKVAFGHFIQTKRMSNKFYECLKNRPKPSFLVMIADFSITLGILFIITALVLKMIFPNAI